VIIGKNENLRLSGEPSKGTGVKNSVAVSLETGPKLVRFLRSCPVSRALASGGAGNEQSFQLLLSLT
jgi:hypothetical protein